MTNQTDTYRVTFDAAQLADGCCDALEALVDKFGLPRVLSILSEVCIAKSAHLEENWQDSNAAKLWEHASRQIDKTSERIRAPFERHYGRMS